MKVEAVCYDAATHFLRRVKDATPEDIQELAERIQELCTETVTEYLDKGGDE